MAESADSADLAPVANEAAISIDGVQLSELIPTLPLARSSIFEIMKAMNIKSTKGPGPGGANRVAWLSSKDAELLTSAAHCVSRGEYRIADLAGSLAKRKKQATALTASSDSADTNDPAAFISRLEAAERAISSGLGLTTKEVAWILGINPIGAAITRGGITCTRTAKNCWLLNKAAKGSTGWQRN